MPTAPACLSYRRSRVALAQAAGRTNGRLADTDWTPIHYLNRNFPHDVLMGFLRFALVGIVTPVRDGMNLVAKEFVAAQNADDPGVLILSTLAERRDRHQQMLEVLRRNDIHAWHTRFVERLSGSRRLQMKLATGTAS